MSYRSALSRSVVLLWVCGCAGDAEDSDANRQSTESTPEPGTSGAPSTTVSGPSSTEPPSTEPPATSMSACPELAGKLYLPRIGPWLFGPDPGPCSLSWEIGADQGQDTFSYDSNGRLTGSTSGAFNYDQQGRLLSYGSPEYPATVTYDQRGLISVVESEGQFVVTFVFNDQGLLEALEQEHLRRVYAWEGCRILSRTDNYTDGETVISEYSYDNEGRLLLVAAPNDVESYDYSCWQ